MGAINDLKGLKYEDLNSRFRSKGVEWSLNPPHASHMGGVWERKIGAVRRIMEATFAVAGSKTFSYDEFTTIIARGALRVGRSGQLPRAPPIWGRKSAPQTQKIASFLLIP